MEKSMVSDLFSEENHDRHEIVMMSPRNIKPYPNNPRNNDDAVEKVANSISQFGFRSPIIVDKDMVIIAGHTRLKASKMLGLKEVPVMIADDLTDEQTRAYRLADNKTAELAYWDEDLLADELSGIYDIDMADFGFDLMDDDELGIGEDGEVEEVEAPEPPEEPVTKHGDIYQLGRHRLMCGDSTSQADVSKLMDGKKADMVFTDPPYNIGYSGIKDTRSIKNDKMSDEDFIRFLEKSIMPCEVMYVCCSWQYAHLFRKAIENIGQKIKSLIVWDKINPAQHLDLYFKEHELIWYCGPFGGEKTVRGDVWQCKRQVNTVHPTMKPIELVAMALNDHPSRKIVYDGFGGSGSTLIACEQTNRTCYTMELDPKYCDVIVARWEALTGRKAELINGEDTDAQE